MNQEQQLIWDDLSRDALGRNNAKHIHEIANNIGVPPQGTNNDNVRTWIKDMVSAKKLRDSWKEILARMQYEEMEIITPKFQ